ncbi:hypothetical protein F2P81_014057 [Scophthalmus maximus]|uniref:Uncharacterized protein n=1 Tax=Scophthalmus maximus TaxID=52904 RepID=A0A6A4SSK6_SCOMX|nr:hypothetical protein F2P81_014057 [Scophthalmus maximus]
MPPNAPEQNQALFQRNVSLTRAGVVACRTISVRDIRRPVVFTIPTSAVLRILTPCTHSPTLSLLPFDPRPPVQLSLTSLNGIRAHKQAASTFIKRNYSSSAERG